MNHSFDYSHSCYPSAFSGLQRVRLLLPIIFALALNALLAQDTTVSIPPTNQLAISSISVEGTNLALVATIPPGLDQAILEISPTLNAGWEEVGSLSVPTNAAQVTFTIPKPSPPTAFFRLKATLRQTSAPLLSPELQYVAVPSLSSNLSNTGDAIFRFKGLVDGSDKIVITRDGALWNHVHWDWPRGDVTINGAQWNPKEKNYVTTLGTAKFLPETFSLDSVSLETIQGRDVVALECAPDALIIYVNDTPSGPGEHEFAIHFHPIGSAASPAAATVGRASLRAVGISNARLKIAARIDGSDCLTITSTQATWHHKFFACPTAVTLNEIQWNPKKNKILKNEGTNTFLRTGLDLSTAKITARKGRDLATLWADHDSLQIWFADNPNGSDSYELEISFGQ
jgi:hypothetical protein